MRSIERNIYNLHERIDNLEEECAYWREKYEQEVKERNEETNARLVDAKKGVANMLMFALSVRDDEHGNLILPAEERKQLAENLR